MRFARLSNVLRSLRFRLAFYNALVVFLLLTATLIVVRERMRFTLLQEFDVALRQDAQEIRLAIRQLHPHWQPVYEEINRKAQGHALARWFVKLLDDRGQLVWSSLEAPEFPTDPFEETVAVDGRTYRVVQAAPPAPPVAGITILVGASLDAVYDDIALLTRMMLLAMGLILLVAPAAGYVLAGRATAPLTQIIRTTARLRPSNLDERLPLRQTGDELDQLSQTINKLLDRIATYLDQKRDFLANAAHELRSPLTAIRTTAEVGLYNSRSEEEYQTLLGDIAEESTSLGTLVNQLLLLAETDAGRLVGGERSIRLDLVVSKAVEMFAGVAEAQGVELIGDRLAPLRVTGEEYLFRQVVHNLIDNAIKFTPSGGRVTVEVQLDAARQHALLVVSDTGVGIPPEELGRVFERFFRGDRSRHRGGGKRGTGLGLSICHSIASILRGRIAVESRPGEGSTFRVWTPLAGTPIAEEA